MIFCVPRIVFSSGRGCPASRMVKSGISPFAWSYFVRTMPVSILWGIFSAAAFAMFQAALPMAMTITLPSKAKVLPPMNFLRLHREGMPEWQYGVSFLHQIKSHSQKMHLFLLYIGFYICFSSIANQRGKNNRKRRIKKAYIKGKRATGEVALCKGEGMYTMFIHYPLL